VADGKPAGIRCFLIDCTDWKHRTDELTESEGNWRRLLDEANDGFYVADERGVLTYANSALARLHGLSDPVQMLGHSFFEFVDADEIEAISAQFAADCRTGSFSLTRAKLRRPDAVLAIGEVRPGGLYREGRLVGTFGVMRDVTADQQRELQLLDALREAKEASCAKSEFLASMSHEIRTPMNGVIGMIDLLLWTNLDAEQRDCAETAQQSAEALLDIINDILDLSKIEAGKAALEYAPFDLQKTIEDVTALLEIKANEKRIDLIVKSNLDSQVYFVGDAGRIRQIVFNLVGNAIKFTEHGHVLVSIGSSRIDENRREVVISVEDTGIGIPADRLGHLFEQFVQVHKSTAGRYGGTGLGLAISRSLATMMGGNITASSVANQGSMFRVEIPLPIASAPRDDSGSFEFTVDNAVNRKVLVEYLARWGLRTSEAASAEEALRMLVEGRNSGEAVRVVLIDHEMPEVDGEMLGQAIRVDECFGDTALILLSSHMLLPNVRKRIVEIGFAACLNKPVRVDDLKRTLVLALGAPSTPATKSLEEKSPAIAALRAPEQTAAHPPLGLLVLVAEDNLINQKVASHLIRKLGCTVQVVADGKEAVEMVRMAPYDVVFMDCAMPTMDGFQATAAIRYWESNSRHVPIIALTAHAMSGFSEKCLQAGMDGYLSKPIRIEDLRRILHSIRDGKDAGSMS
jgi:PAS domain S-box-containing protein